MRGSAALVLSLLLTAGMAVLDTPKDPEPKPARPVDVIAGGLVWMRFAGSTTSPAIPAITTTSFKLNQFGGYGSPFANNSGCSTENPPANQLTPSGGGTCAGDTRIISEGTFGFWHKFYQGPKGGLRWGAQYSYFSKNGYSGASGMQPHAVDNMVWTSFRYYLP